MLDIFNIPMYYISFKRNLDLEKNMSNRGFSNINHFPAINGKNYKPKNLVNEGIITNSAYIELLQGRQRLSGLPSLGAVGCSLSHYNIWKICIERNLPYIIAVEEDCYMPVIKKYDLFKIRNILKKNNSVYVSTYMLNKKKVTMLMLTHFCILSQGACKELVKYMFPIEMQIDAYMAALDTRKIINLDGFFLASQDLFHFSSVQDRKYQYLLPNDMWYYVCMYSISIIIMILFYMFVKKHVYNYNVKH